MIRRRLVQLARLVWVAVAFAATVVRTILAVLIAVLFGWRYGSRP